ncbi:glycosyltransferase family 2 protein [Helicobacter sp. MIT 05-5294]|uniref:glycosyltransferase family 2 protein n=1 Tax=Helicobacter sp. MIT 05-5294 TaxID=1548150 RepID=UPI000AE1EF67|nr:glycosyltransferase family 2 protein [Helicobacter sp. MIT 05-5294]
MQIKVSIIIPVYNAEKYLIECLESCVNQTLKEIEIIAIDDCSTDSSLSILRQYSLNNEKLSIIAHTNNIGAGGARNNGILAAKGEYVAFMDPDDFYYSSDVLERLYTKAKENQVSICGGSLVRLRDGVIQSHHNDPFFFNKEALLSYQDYQYEYGYTRFIYVRDFLMQNNIFFPNYRRYQDPPFFIKAMAIASKFYVICGPVYVYRVYHKDIEWTESKVIDVIHGLSDCLKLSLQYNLDNIYIYIVKDCIYSRHFIKKTFRAFSRNPKVQDEILKMLDIIEYSVIHKYNVKFKLKPRFFYQKIKFCSFLRKKIRFVHF